MVEIFKTNVQEHEQASLLVNILRQHFPLCRINFDLTDCDNILRVEGEIISSEKIISLLTLQGIECNILM